MLPAVMMMLLTSPITTFELPVAVSTLRKLPKSGAVGGASVDEVMTSRSDFSEVVTRK